MRRLLYVGLAVGAAVVIAAIVLSIARVSGTSDVERIKSALRLQTNCAHVAVRRPSRARIVKRWAGATVQSADVACSAAGPQVVYVKFIDRITLTRAVASAAPDSRYCVIGDAIVIDRLAGAASTVLSDMCQSLGGSLGGAPD